MSNKKTYRKFAASSIAATAAVAAIAPVASAATDASEFTDVQPGDSHYDGVQYVVEKGIQGYEDGSYGVKDSVTREHAAIFFAKVLGYENNLPSASDVSDYFSDVSSDHTYADYIAGAGEQGVFKGNSNDEFSPDRALTREQMASTIVNAFGLEDNGADVDVNLENVHPTHKTSVQILANLGITNQLDDFRPDEEVTRGQFATFLYQTNQVLNAEPKVESVSAINAKQIEVQFNQAVDGDTLFTDAASDDYSLLSSAISIEGDAEAESITFSNLEGKLSEDEKTLTITNADGTEFFDGKYTVTVNDTVKTTSGDSIAPFINNINVDDVTSPEVSEVSYDASTDKVTVKLSEAIDGTPEVLRVNGKPVSFDTATAPITELTFDRPASVETGSNATLYIAGATDYNSNYLESYNGSVTFTKDTSALDVSSIEQVDSDSLRIVFNKKLGSISADAKTDLGSALTVMKDGAAFAPDKVRVTPGDTTGKSFDIDFTSADLYGNDTSQDLSLVFADDGLVDVYGNKNDASSHDVTMTKDTVAPTVSGASVSDDNKTITLEFSEGVTVEENSQFVVRRDGINVSGLSISSNEDDNTKVDVELSSGNAFEAGTYTFRLESGAVADLVENNKNALATTSVSVDAEESEEPELNATVTGTTPNTFEIAYKVDGSGVELDTTSALNLSNYKLDGDALPSNADIYIKDDSSNKHVVVIELPEGSVNIGDSSGTNAILSVSGVEDADGNVVTATSDSVLVSDNTPATLQGAELVSSNILKLTFSESVDDTTFDVSDLTLESTNDTIDWDGSGSIPDTVSAEASGNELVLTVTPSESNWTNVVDGNDLSAKIVDVSDDDGLADSLKDTNDYNVKAGDSVSVEK
ncbi:S-layer homology domain-containing protein [Salinibacillus aidingensis]|uniref:S-layer homology domain-containing protein n=1 Tax=Salinibacillus aidingensis TaxID=237684 RepID=A0ABP3KU81_9BACI